jgi:Ca2+-binding EF-hand superfamily protein
MADFAEATRKLQALNLVAKRTEFLEEPEHKYADLPWGEFNKYAVNHVVNKKDFLKAFDELVTVQFGLKEILDKAVPLIGGAVVEGAGAGMEFMEGKEKLIGKAVVEGVWAKRERILKPVSELFFRIFDQDHSETIDKAEYAAAMLMIKSGVNALKKSIYKRSEDEEVTEEFRSQLKAEKAKAILALFAAIDADGSGSIDANELCTYALELIGVFINIFKVINKVVAETTASGVIVDLMSETLSEFPISIEHAVAVLGPKLQMAFTEDPPPKEMVDTVNQLLSDFNKHTGDGVNSISVGRMGGLFAKTLKPLALETLDEMIPDSMIEGMLEEIPMIGPSLAEQTGNFKSKMIKFVEMGGLNSICAAALDFIDLNSDGDLSENELKPILESFVQKDANAFWTSLLKIMDADGSGTIDMDDVPTLSSKFVTLSTTVINTGLDFVKTTLSSMLYDVVPPVMATMGFEDGIDKEKLDEMLSEMMEE